MAGRGLCKVILVGNLGQNPEVRYMPQGGAVANISIATSESWRDKATGEMKEQTEWHRVVIYQRLAEIAGEYLRKGSKVYIEGKLKTRKWTDKDGIERYTTEIVANEMQMLDGRADYQQQSTTRDPVPPEQVRISGEYQPIDTVPPRPRPVQELRPPMEPPIDFNDDIPF